MSVSRPGYLRANLNQEVCPLTRSRALELALRCGSQLAAGRVLQLALQCYDDPRSGPCSAKRSVIAALRSNWAREAWAWCTAPTTHAWTARSPSR